MGQGQGLTDALLDLELYFLLVPLVVDEGKEMFSLAHGATDLVILGGLSQIAFVQMPVNRSVTAGVGGLEDKFLGLSGKAFRKVENGVMLGIDQFDLAVQVLPAAGFYRRERDIIDVIVAVEYSCAGGSTNHGRLIIRSTDSQELLTLYRPSADRCTSLW